MLLLRLPDGRPVEMSDALLRVIGRDRPGAMSTSAPAYTQDPEETATSLRLMADGKLDGYLRRIRILRPRGELVEADVRVDVCSYRAVRDTALVRVSPRRQHAGVTEPLTEMSVGPRGLAVVGGVDWATPVPDRTSLVEAPELTDREREVVARLSAGWRVRRIAESLFLSESTIRNHLTAVYRKFGVRSQVELLDKL
jgi:DNA-binding CsgD family transcriptional regulator